MLNLDLNFKVLSTTDVKKIEDYLGYKIVLPDNFDTLDNNAPTFSTLLYEVLGDAINQKVVFTDWKWSPEDILKQISRIFPNSQIKFTSEKLADEQDNPQYKIKYSIGSDQFEETIDFKALSDWVKKLDQKINSNTNQQLIEVDTGADHYLWFVAKKSFSLKEFEKLIINLDEELQNFDLKVKKKIFFVPIIFQQRKGKLHKLYYENNGWFPTLFAGRVTRGQSVRQGIRHELETNFNYPGKFLIKNLYIRDTVPDKEGVLTQRYTIEIELQDNLDETKCHPLGMTVKLFEVK
ncbi:hypothetical protein KC644_01510 [Candidatus Berkelbacteria bacterium]|nr:hypothetical protein [Candidatus Berkelbacteria bacterium]